MYGLYMTWSEFEGHLLFETFAIAWFNYDMFTRKLQNTHGLWFKHHCQKWTRVLKVTGSHVHFKSGSRLIKKWC